MALGLCLPDTYLQQSGCSYHRRPTPEVRPYLPYLPSQMRPIEILVAVWKHHMKETVLALSFMKMGLHVIRQSASAYYLKS